MSIGPDFGRNKRPSPLCKLYFENRVNLVTGPAQRVKHPLANSLVSPAVCRINVSSYYNWRRMVRTA